MALKTVVLLGLTGVAAICATVVAVQRPTRQEPTLEADFFRNEGGSGSVKLLVGDRVRPGDELFLKVQASQEFHFYVVSLNSIDEPLMIYPCRTWGTSPGLGPNRWHRLPGTEGYWPVHSVAQQERLLVIASSQPIAHLDAAFRSGTTPEPCAAPISSAARSWIDGMANFPWGSVDGLFQQTGDPDGETWVAALDLRGEVAHGH